MAPRRRATLLTATPASLALALTILLAATSAAAGRSGNAAHADRRAGTSVTTETAAAEATPAPAAATPAPTKTSTATAREVRRRERAASSAPAAGEAAQPAAQAPAREAHQHREAGSLPATVKRAERALERAASGAARRARRAEAAEERAAGAAPASRSVSALRTREQKELEREQRVRAREERRVAEGKKETKRAREAREAREVRESVARARGGGPKSIPVTTATAAAAAPTAAPAAATASASPPSIAAQHGVRASAGARGKRAGRAASGRRPASHAPRASGATLAAPPALAVAAGAATRPTIAHRHHVRSDGSGSHASSPIVTTVTRIIGVIPAALWILIGALAAAALAFAASTRVAAARARRLARQRRELLEDVGLLQAALLPELPERLGPVGTTAAYRPASGPGAGGDFYDVFALEDGLLAVIVGDVSGHGRSALPHTTLLRFTLRAYLEAGLSPRQALRAAAPGLERQLGGYFATVVLATYDPRRRELTYSCAGHPHPILTGLSAEAPVIAASAPPVGAGRATGTRQTVVSLPGGTVACFYTDGVVEARTGGELYGTERLEAALGSLDGHAAAAALLDLVREQTDRRPDDMAACLIEVPGSSDAAPEIVSEELELDGREESRARTRRFLSAVGLDGREADAIIDSARAIATEHGTALLRVRLDGARPQATLTHDNVAPLRARAMERTQEVAL